MRTEIARRTFSQAAATIWNDLPLDSRSAATHERFRFVTKKHFYELAFMNWSRDRLLSHDSFLATSCGALSNTYNNNNNNNNIVRPNALLHQRHTFWQCGIESHYINFLINIFIINNTLLLSVKQKVKTSAYFQTIMIILIVVSFHPVLQTNELVDILYCWSKQHCCLQCDRLNCAV